MYDIPSPKKIMGHGQGLYVEKGADGKPVYHPTADTIDVANALGIYLHLHPNREEIEIILSGGYPLLASFGEVAEPPEGINEATFQADWLHNVWGIPRGRMQIEGDALHTFQGFTLPVERGMLTPGEFTPDSPLILVVRREQILRASIIGRQVLAITDDRALFRLWEMTPYEGLLDARERWLTKLTHLAMLDVQPEPGNLVHTQLVFERFGQLYREAPDMSSLQLPDLPQLALLPHAA